MFGLGKNLHGGRHKRVHKQGRVARERGRFFDEDVRHYGRPGGDYAGEEQGAARKVSSFGNSDSGYCPLCHNHCLLGEPACPKGAAFVLQQSASKPLADLESGGTELMWHEASAFPNKWGASFSRSGAEGVFPETKILHHKGKYMNERESRHGEEGFGESLSGLFRRTLKYMARAFHHHGHRGHAQKRVLAILKEKESISQRDLLEYLGVRSASLSELLAKLEHNGLITRDREERDKRSHVITITESGRAAVADYEKERSEGEEAFFACLTAEERQQLASILGKLVQALDLESGQERHRGRHGHDEHHGRHGHFGRRRGRHGHLMREEGPDTDMRHYAHPHEGPRGHGPEGHHERRKGHHDHDFEDFRSGRGEEHSE